MDMVKLLSFRTSDGIPVGQGFQVELELIRSLLVAVRLPDGTYMLAPTKGVLFSVGEVPAGQVWYYRVERVYLIKRSAPERVERIDAQLLPDDMRSLGLSTHARTEYSY